MWVGLEAEEYDRKYQDRVLLKRIVSYFSPYKRAMILVVFLLTISSLTTAFQPILASLIITNLETNPDLGYVLYLILIIFIFNISPFVKIKKRQLEIITSAMDLREELSRNPHKKITDNLNEFNKFRHELHSLARKGRKIIQIW